MVRQPVLAVLACLALLQACAPADTVDEYGYSSGLRLNDDVETVIADLEASIPELLEQARIPGLAIALIRDRELVWDEGQFAEAHFIATGECCTRYGAAGQYPGHRL